MEEKEKIHVAIINYRGQLLYAFDMNTFSVSESETIERTEDFAKDTAEVIKEDEER